MGLMAGSSARMESSSLVGLREVRLSPHHWVPDILFSSFLLHQLSLKSAFIRGSVIRYVHIPAKAVDTQLLEDATRRGEFAQQLG